MSGIPTNRSNITLPADVSAEIMQKVQLDSAVMKLAQKIELPGRGIAIPVVVSDPEAHWTEETDIKPSSNPSLATKMMTGHTLSVIVPFSNQFRRDAEKLYAELVKRLPKALGAKFDATVLTGSAPGSNFDTLANVTAQSIGTDAYGGLVAADTDVAEHDGIMDGVILSPKGKGILLASKDDNGRPLFINNVAEGAVPMVLGARTELSKGAYKSGSPNTVGIVGDWTQAYWGAVEDVQIAIADQATLTLEDGTILNLFERNMFAVRAEIEIGFVADTSVFNKLTATTVSA